MFKLRPIVGKSTFFNHIFKAYDNMKHVFNFSSLDDSLRGTMLKLCLLCLILMGGVIYPYRQIL